MFGQVIISRAITQHNSVACSGKEDIKKKKKEEKCEEIIVSPF